MRRDGWQELTPNDSPYFGDTNVTYDHCIQNTMFIPYDRRNPDIIPNNTFITPPPPPPIVPYLVEQPYLIYNKNNEFVGFSWNYGQSINLCFTYSPFFPLVLPNGIHTTLSKYISDKAIKVTIYNFRMEEMFTSVAESNDALKSVFIRIDSERSLEMVRGLYYLQAEVYTEDKKDDGSDLSPDGEVTNEFYTELSSFQEAEKQEKQRLILIDPTDLFLQVL